MASSLLAIGLLAVGVVGELENFPHMAAPSLVCGKAPYQQYLPLSSLPGAQDFCKTQFPLNTPKCSATVTATRTAGVTTHTDTITNFDVTVTTITTGTAATTTTTETVQPPAVFTSTTTTATSTVYICTDASGTPPGFNPPNDSPTPTPTPDDGSSTTDTGSTQEKRDLSPAQRSSLQKQLSTVRTLANRPKGRPTASTICRCIQTNPPCSTSTQTSYTTVKSTKYTTVRLNKTPVYTTSVPNTETSTITSTVTQGDAATVNLISSETVTSYSTDCAGAAAASQTPEGDA